MNIKNYLEKNWIYENEKFFEFFEKDKIKDILKNKSSFNILWLILATFFVVIMAIIIIFFKEYYEILKYIIIIIFTLIWLSYSSKTLETRKKLFEKFEFENRNWYNYFKEIYIPKKGRYDKTENFLNIFIKINKIFWDFWVKREKFLYLKYFLIFLIFSPILAFAIMMIIFVEEIKTKLFLAFFFLVIIWVFIFVLVNHFKSKSKTWNPNFDKKFTIISNFGNSKISSEIQEKLLELDKIIKTDFEIIFSWDEISIKINLFSDIPLSLEKKLLRNYILFKKCEKIFE